MSNGKLAAAIAVILAGLGLTLVVGVYAALKAPPRLRLVREAEPLPPLELPAGPEAYTIVQYRQDMLKFNRRVMVAAYEKVGVRNEAWDEAAKRYLERTAQAFSHQLDAPSCEELVEEGKALVEGQGCTDPMVLYCYGLRLQDLGRLAPAESVLRRAVEGFNQIPYPRARAWFAAARLAELCEERGKRAEVGEWRDLAIRWIGEAGGEIREADHEPTIFIDILSSRWDTLFEKHWRELYEALRQNPKAHPYLVDYIGGWCQVEEAWEARGSGWASEVTEAGWRGFARHLAEAEKLLTKAWENYPHYPEAPGQMVYVVMGQTQDEELMRLWFERSVTAHLDYGLPYYKLLWALRPRWGGTHEKMYEVGEACLATGRFDTETPRWYLRSIYDIWEDSERRSDVWQWDGVYENLTKMCQGYMKAAKTPRQRDYNLTLLAQLSWFTGHYKEARRAFEELGERAQPVVFSDWNLRSSLEDARGQVFASSEVDSSKLKQAGQLARRGEYAQARALYQELLKQAKSQYAIDYLKQGLAAADLQVRYQEGQWVSLQPDASFQGWTQEEGKWEVEPDGTLKATARRNGCHMTNYSNFGGRLELCGEVEFAADPSLGSKSEIILLLDSGSTDDDWGYDFVRYSLSLTEGTASVTRRHETEGRVTVKAKVKPQAKFALQLWEGSISTWLDGKPIHQQVRVKEGATPARAGISIGSPHPGGVYRFRNLRVHKLTEEPKAGARPTPP